MMGEQAWLGSGLLLMFVLGLRHGLDPDHIACIDGLTWRAIEQERRLAPWVGTLFALGHGLLVTTIAVLLARLSGALEIPQGARGVVDWVPTALLVLVGTLNLRQLLRGDTAYRPVGWKARLLPARLRDRSGPLAVLLVGVLFAAVFDTATQVSAWGYVAAQGGSGAAALVAGLAFTAGMMITDTADGRLVCRLAERTDAQAAGPRYRRALGWAIVALSYGVAGYKVLLAMLPGMEVDHATYTLVGLAFVMAALLASVWLRPTRWAAAGTSGR